MAEPLFTECNEDTEPKDYSGKLYLLKLRNQFFAGSEENSSNYSLKRTTHEYALGTYQGNGQWLEYIRETAFDVSDGQTMTYYSEGFGEGLTTGVINGVEFEIRQTVEGFMEVAGGE